VVPRAATISELLASYDGVLLDAYGVLVDGRGALPGARELIDALNGRGIPYAIVTNDASRSQATYERRFAGLGLAIPGDRVVSAGSLLPGYFRAKGLAGARTCVLGTADSIAFVVEGGGVPVDVVAGMEVDAVAVCDDSGTPFLEGIELAVSALVRAVEAGRTPAFVLPNPDLVYPKGPGELGFTAGAMALLIETALARRFPGHQVELDRLGKPMPHIFREAQQQLGVSRVVMIGDQLETDVVGALAAGIDVALLAGVSRWVPHATLTPTYLLDRLAP
jgi:HAD superfamily hydrolase (TIGR01450 family)